MRELHTVPDRPSPGPRAGGLIGVAAGLLLAWLWVAKDRDVALAVSLVFVGLVAAVAAGATSWRPFAIGMLTTAALLVAAVVAIAYEA